MAGRIDAEYTGGFRSSMFTGKFGVEEESEAKSHPDSSNDPAALCYRVAMMERSMWILRAKWCLTAENISTNYMTMIVIRQVLPGQPRGHSVPGKRPNFSGPLGPIITESPGQDRKRRSIADIGVT